jgi:predicted aldo/keto reductase-like oxidoreductase
VLHESFHETPARFTELGALGRVCRVGLATRGDTRLDPPDVLEAVRRGVDYLNWCGYADGMSAAVRQLGARRGDVRVAVQLESRDAAGARKEIDAFLGELGTTYVDVVAYYYVEHPEEWEEIHARGGAAEAVEAARGEGKVRAVGATTHQRALAARMVRERRLDLLMVRYNAAHRGAEEEVFPVADEHGTPVVAYTCLRWGALLRPTPVDPAGFVPPRAPQWYRFVLCHPAVSVALMAPNGRAELEEDLTILDAWRGLSASEHAALREHGDRVHRHAGAFP